MDDFHRNFRKINSMKWIMARFIQEMRLFAQRIEPLRIIMPALSCIIVSTSGLPMSLRKLFFAIIVAFMPFGSALASPFCVSVTGMPTECIYDDATPCKNRAAQLSGFCTINTSEITAAYGEEKFCIVDSSRVPQCIYVDRTLCESAQSNGSVCVNNNFKNVNEAQPDPFANDPNRNY
jgi:hypothetical protein